MWDFPLLEQGVVLRCIDVADANYALHRGIVPAITSSTHTLLHSIGVIGLGANTKASGASIVPGLLLVFGGADISAIAEAGPPVALAPGSQESIDAEICTRRVRHWLRGEELKCNLCFTPQRKFSIDSIQSNSQQGQLRQNGHFKLIKLLS